MGVRGKGEEGRGRGKGKAAGRAKIKKNKCVDRNYSEEVKGLTVMCFRECGGSGKTRIWRCRKQAQEGSEGYQGEKNMLE